MVFETLGAINAVKERRFLCSCFVSQLNVWDASLLHTAVELGHEYGAICTQTDTRIHTHTHTCTRVYTHTYAYTPYAGARVLTPVCK
jgi:hypothetical protein